MGAANIMIVQFAGILIRFYPNGAVESVAGSAAMTDMFRGCLRQKMLPSFQIACKCR